MSKTYVVKENSGCGCGTLLVAVLILSVIGSIMPYIAVFLVFFAIAVLIWYLIVRKPQIDIQKAKRQEEEEIAEIERQNALKRRKILAMKEAQNIDKMNASVSNKTDLDWDEF